jgi:hypothetical protein
VQESEGMNPRSWTLSGPCAWGDLGRLETSDEEARCV